LSDRGTGVTRARRLSLLFCFLATPLLAQNTPRRGGTLVIAGGSDLQNINSLVNADAFTHEVLKNVLFVSLVRLGPNLQPAPALARSWTMTGDTAVLFRLRRDIRWQDGKPTTAHDVVFTYTRAMDTLTAFPNADIVSHFKQVTAVDSYTVRVRITPRREPILGLAELPIMPKHLLDTIAPQRLRQAAFNKQPVGNGPFRFVAQRANDRWTFEANPSWPRELGGPPNIERLIWRVIPDNIAQVTELRTGAVDLILAARADQLKELDARPEIRAIVKPSRRYAMITWNGKRAPLNLPAVRRALTMALNRPRMIELLRGGFAQVAVGPIPPTHWAFDPTLSQLPYDTAAARRLLAQAGYTDRNGDGVLESAEGKPLELELKIAANNAFNRDVGEMVRAELARIGVRILPRPVDGATLIGDITSAERNFDGAFLVFETDLELNLSDAFHSKGLGGPMNSSSYSNPALDRAFDRAYAARTVQAARPQWNTVQRILRDDQPWTFLWYAPELLAVNERVRGLQVDIRGIFVNLPAWWIAPN
jgi:peptide/nickel transport system substrate-binding protein